MLGILPSGRSDNSRARTAGSDSRATRHRPIGRVEAERVHSQLKAEQHPDRARRDLGLHRQARLHRLAQGGQQGLVVSGPDRALGQREGQRSARGLDHPAQQGELGLRVGEVRHHLQHPGVRRLQPHGDADQLVLGRRQGRGRLAVAGAVVQRARGGKAERAGLCRAPRDGGHGGDVGRCRGLAVRAPLAHHMHAQRRVRQLGADVDVEPPRLQRVQIVRIALPVPRQALAQHRKGDVLHPLHQSDQSVVVLWPAGGEAHAAIAHYRRGHPVPGRRLHPLVPGRLAVVVGVDVDEAGRHDQAARVDLLGARPRDRAHRGDAALLDRDVGRDDRPTRAVRHLSPADD
jgi:hypothetical protein